MTLAWFRMALAIGLFWTGETNSAKAQLSTGNTSPAFDTKLYNPDAVAQSHKKFGHWNLVCAELTGLKRRFCNLTSLAAAADGKFYVAIVVSTTDDGKPAALLRMPLMVSLREGVDIVTTSLPGAKGKAKTAKAKKRHVDFASCEQQVCTTILPLQLADLATLSGRGSMNLRVFVLANSAANQVASLLPPSQPIEVVFDGSGFAEALQASQTP